VLSLRTGPASAPGVPADKNERAAKKAPGKSAEPDVAKAFPSSEAVNRSLPALAALIRQQSKKREA